MKRCRAGDGPHPVDIRAGRLLCRRRKLLGMTGRRFAEALGVTVEQLREHETGASPIPASRLDEMARLLGVTVGFFFAHATGTDSDPPEAGDIGDELAHLPSADEVSRLIRQFARISDTETRAFAIDRMKAIAEHRVVPFRGKGS